MQKIFALIAQHYVLLGFIALEILSLSLIINNNYSQNSSFYNWTSQQTYFFNQKINSVRQYFLLKKVNESLLENNTKLLIDNNHLLQY